MMKEKNTLLEQLEFWDKLSQNQRYIIQKGSIEQGFAKGNVISRTDEGCKGAIILTGGQIRCYILSEEGREITLYRLHVGDVCVLSASCMLDSIAFDVIIEAVDDTNVILIPSSILHEVYNNNPYVALFFERTANERFSDVMWTMQQILFLGADKRVAIYLWDEMAKSGKPVIVNTHDEVARYIGSAREVVTRILRYFAEEGIVSLGRGKIEILDKEKLKAFL